jgi:hypothetical protein
MNSFNISVFMRSTKACCTLLYHNNALIRLISSPACLSTNYTGTRKLFHHSLLLRRRKVTLVHYTEPTKCYIITGQNLYTTKDNDEDCSKQKLAQVSPRIGMFYKCKICSTQNSHTFSRKAYQEGVVIVQCVSCKSNHLIADNLGWFKDVDKRNIEEIMAAKGEEVKRITDIDLPKDLLDQLKVRQDS